MPLPDIAVTVRKYLDDIQAAMLARAQKTFDERLKIVTEWKDVVDTLDAKNALILPWCEREICEDQIKDKSKGR